jgi:tetratricopeptide (TPR) repeat protein
MTNAMTRHSDAELLAAFVDGQLDHEQLQEVTTHLASCEECRGVIGEAAAFQRESKPRRTWLKVAAAVMVAIIVFPFARAYLHDLHDRKIRNEVAEVHAAQAKQRMVETRFSGQDSWSNYPVMRGSEGPEHEVTDDELRILAATAELQDTTKNDTTPVALRAYAFAQAVGKDSKGAVETLNRVPPETRDAATWNDIAAVHYAARDYPAALDAANHALQIEPKMREALFNRALILQRSERYKDALDTWNAYLAVDPTGPWADEARKNIDNLPQ